MSDDQTSNVMIKTLMDYKDGKKPEYYGVTDLVNPVRKYFEIMHPEVQDPPELQAKYDHGNSVQDSAFHWFSTFPGFEGREIEATGNSVGITGLRGRMDFVFSGHIVEFKTTAHGIFTSDDVFDKNPQDLEQLVTYVLLTHSTDREHFLVYSSEDYENSFRAFTVSVKDEEFLQILKKRMDSFRDAIDRKDPSSLSRCRYFGFGCKFQESGTCSCSDIQPMDNTVLKRSVELSRNEELESELEQKKESIPEVEMHHLSLWDLLTPRKAYLRELGLLEDSGEDMDQESGEVRRQTANAIYSSPFYVQRRELSINGHSLGYATMLSIETPDPDGNRKVTRLYPSTDRIFNREPAELSSDSISPYHLLRLAMICSVSGSNVGYLVLGFRNDSKRISSYRVTFKNLPEVRKRMSDRIMELESSIANRYPGNLPECPHFLFESCGNNCLCKSH